MPERVILVVEDNEKSLRLVRDILESQGYGVLLASNGNLGLELAREKKPDLIIMDIQMPDIDGLTATRMLKDDETTAHIPVLALTAMAMKGDRELILQAGCDGYLPKPIMFDTLLAIIKELL